MRKRAIPHLFGATSIALAWVLLPGIAAHAANDPQVAQLFAKFAVLDTPKFHQTDIRASRAAKYTGNNISLFYVYRDGRFTSTYNNDVKVEIEEFSSAEEAQAYLKKRLKLLRSMPEAEANKIKLPPCHDEKQGNDDYTGPEKIIRKLRHPNGGDILVLRDGDFNMSDCSRGSNWGEYVRWTDGRLYFEASSSPPNGLKTGFGIAEEFTLEYLSAIGTPALP